jgi:copper chaperone CopZ
MGYYLHDVPGRMRVKSPLVKNNPGAANDIKNLLSLIHGVNSTEFNLTTGSVLIYYHPDKLNRGDLIDLLSEKGYFDKSKAVTNDQVIQSAAEGTLSFFGKSIVSDLVFALI